MKKLEHTRISGVLINLKPDSGGGGGPRQPRSGGKPPGKKRSQIGREALPKAVMSSPPAVQVGEDRAAASRKVDSLTGVRAVAAMTVVLTHAAYTTGKYSHGYGGSFLSRMEIGVPIFFVLSGFLLFAPWVRTAASGDVAPSVRRYAWHRVRRIMPAYVVTVLIAYASTTSATARTESRPHLDRPAAQPHADPDLLRRLRVHVSASGAHADVEPRGRGVVLRGLCRCSPTSCWWFCAEDVGSQGFWSRGLLVLSLITPAWIVLFHTTHFLPDGARLWLPTYLAWFLGGMLLAALQPMGVRAYALRLPSPGVDLLSHRLDADRRSADDVARRSCARGWSKAVFYAVIATLAVAPLALGITVGTRACWPAGRWCSSARSPTRSS